MVARALHLGEVASVNVPVTALIVIGPGLSESTAVHRLSSTLLGAGIALEHTVVQIRTIARTLFDSAVSGGIADST